MTTITFDVLGTPAPQGSKRHVGNGVMIESSAKVKPWRQDVKYAALEVLGSRCPFPHGEPVCVFLTFRLARPRSHYRTGKNSHLLRDAAPKFPASKPDIDKLVRSTLDAIGEAGIWHDDSQVIYVGAGKWYANDQPPGARVEVYPT